MPEYIVAPVDADPDAIAQAAFDYLAAQIAGWLPSAPNLDTIMIETFARMTAESAEVASRVGPEIFRYFGRFLVDIPPVDASQATGATTWTMIDNSGYTIPAGTVVSLSNAAGEKVYFETTAEVVVLAGSTATAAGGVTIRAIDAGAAGSGLSGVVSLVDSLSFVSSIAIVGVTTGGVDAETDGAYLNRLREELTLFTPRPILPRDFEILSRRISGVERAVAIDQYNPDYNQLTANQSSVETDTTGLVAFVNATIARTTATFLQGAAALRVTGTAIGVYAAATTTGASGEAVAVGGYYTALSSFRPNSGTRSCRVGIAWYTSGGALISTSYGTPVSAPTGIYTAAFVTALAPATAAFAALVAEVTGTAGGEFTDIDALSFHEGISTTWQLGDNLPGTGYARYLTMAAIDTAGAPVSAAIRGQLETYLDGLREVNFVIRTTDALLTAVNVTFTAKCYPGFDTADVQARAISAVQAFLNPAAWGLPATGDSNDWLLEKTVRFYEVGQAINSVEGLWYIVSYTVNGGTADVVLPGIAPLPTAGTISGTVTL